MSMNTIMKFHSTWWCWLKWC